MMGADVAGAAPLPATAAEERCGEGAAAQEGDHLEDWNERDAEEVLCCPAAEGDTPLAPVTVKKFLGSRNTLQVRAMQI